jgi:predicted O-methyltransferase YrrM
VRCVPVKPTRIVRGPFSKYLNQQETSILIELVESVAPEVMIEFGCNLGITSLRVMQSVRTIERYIGIDVPYEHIPALACQREEIPLTAGCIAGVDSRFFIHLAPSIGISKDELEPCDAVFIDGDHSEEAVLHESWLARSLVRPGGVIVWHDYTNPAVEVTQALDRLYAEGWPIAHVEGSWLAFMRIGDEYENTSRPLQH